MVIPLSAIAADSGSFYSDAGLSPTEPYKAPSVDLPVLVNVHEIKQSDNKVKLVHFWASWCIPCRKEFPALQRLYHDYNKTGIVIITIAADSTDNAKKYIVDNKITLPVMIDQYGKSMFDYRVKTLPSSYLIDRKGNVRYFATGQIHWDTPAVRRIIRNMLEEK